MSGWCCDLDDTQHRDHRKPDHEHRTEHDADAGRALELNGEQPGQKTDGDRDDGVAESRRRHMQSLHRRQHADRWRYDAVAEQQARAEHQRPQQQRCAAPSLFMQQAVEREDAALAIILRAQYEKGVFDGDDDGDRPDHQRYAAKDVGRRLRCAGPPEKQLVHRIKRRRADIAVNDTERADAQPGETAARHVA